MKWLARRMIDDLWYKNGVIYCLSVGTYMDANGDGIGDFKGLLRRLDYLQGLGVTAIWLMPFQPSPGKDDGYDISDYYGVDPRYGTLGDFVEFTHGCRAARHPRHHRSRRQSHLRSAPWFQDARRDPRRSPYRDWYVWADKKPANAGIPAWSFPACRNPPGPAIRAPSAWYFHRFYDFQPDLNTSNPLVQAEILKIMGFWIQLGRFRIPHGCGPVRDRQQGRQGQRKPVEQYDMLRGFREFLQWREGDAIILARPMFCRTPTWIFRRRRRPHADDVQLPGQSASVLCTGVALTAARWSKRSRPRNRGPPTAQWGMFLRNHDELDLGRLKKAQRETVFADVRARQRTCSSIDRGIRRRLAPMLRRRPAPARTRL